MIINRKMQMNPFMKTIAKVSTIEKLRPKVTDSIL